MNSIELRRAIVASNTRLRSLSVMAAELSQAYTMEVQHRVDLVELLREAEQQEANYGSDNESAEVVAD